MIGKSPLRANLSRLALLCVIAAPAPALAQSTRTFVDLTGSVGYSTNPFLDLDGDGSAFGRVSAFAAHSISGERGQTEFTGFVENSTYLNDYGSKQIFELAAHTRYKVSESLQLFGDAGFSGDVGGQLYGRFNNLVPVAPPVPQTGGLIIVPDQFNTDVVNLDRRQYNASGRIGAAFTISQRDSLSVSAGAQHVFFGSDGDDLDYTVTTGNVGWQHRLTERTSVGARVGLQRAYYAGDNTATVISPQVSLTTRFAEGWDADLAAGVSFVSRRSPLDNDRSVGPALDASVCRTTESERYCGRGSHSVQTVSGQNARRTTSVGADFFKRLNPRDTLQARIGAIRYAGADSLTESESASYYTGGVSFSRKFSDRLSGGGDLGARKYVQSESRSIPGDFTGSAFLRYRLGDVN